MHFHVIKNDKKCTDSFILHSENREEERNRPIGASKESICIISMTEYVVCCHTESQILH